uniref:Uncharacterized protein n=1 Tax=Agrobacterium tumefaciens TaxID=358 RepID=K7X7D8_AGRTU|nr:Hypothetical protein [Agrobacterium radiobacter]
MRNARCPPGLSFLTLSADNLLFYITKFRKKTADKKIAATVAVGPLY